ncbi:MAG: CDP-glucose 4,6-dehydratase [Lachnospiraceae bacterium]|nr:CDP-glucose 4,6-dehydratase [Lachnospiraceae bacterium]
MAGVEMTDLTFYKGKKVLITGHTGFKGGYLSALLSRAGAEVTGYSLEPPTNPSLFELCKLKNDLDSITGDVRDFDHLLKVFKEKRPEIVFHLAAQPIVRTSYREPRLTYETNVMGTVNLLECVRETDCVHSVLNITTDKVYLNTDEDKAFTEDMPLDGYDPYSNSKSCSELVTHSYIKSFFYEKDAPRISTARAGNVIGGGDFAPDRLIPDCVRAAEKHEKVIIRNPASTRPFQHVLEPVTVYADIAAAQYDDPEKADFYNVGPDFSDIRSAGELAQIFCREWGEGLECEVKGDGGPHEASFLRLDCTKLKKKLDWKSVWNVEDAVRYTVRWSRVYVDRGDVRKELFDEIDTYLGDMKK